RLGREDRALGAELLAQFAEILDDAVVHHGYAVAGMGMGIGLVRAPVGRPAGMADASGAGQRRLPEPALEILQLAFRPQAGEPTAFEGGDTGGIIAAIFQPLERIDERLGHRRTSENTDDPTHYSFTPSRACFSAAC